MVLSAPSVSSQIKFLHLVKTLNVRLKMGKFRYYNIGYTCAMLQCLRGLGNKTAMRWIDAHGSGDDDPVAGVLSYARAMAEASEE